MQGTDITVKKLHPLMLVHAHQRGMWLSPALVTLCRLNITHYDYSQSGILNVGQNLSNV